MHNFICENCGQEFPIGCVSHEVSGYEGGPLCVACGIDHRNYEESLRSPGGLDIA